MIGNFLKCFDVIMLTETWSSAKSSYGLDGFDYFDFHRNYRHVRARKAAGGQGIFIRKEINKGVEIIRSYKDELAWLKLKKKFFHLTDDIYIGSVYVYPEDSTCANEDQFVILQQELCNLPDNGYKIICGDFIARINITNYYIHEFDNGSDGGLSTLLNAEENQHVESVFAYLQRRNILERYSMDTCPANKHGKQLIDLCKATSMFMLNGRWDRDRTIGKYTWSDVTGSGVIDYVICTTEMHKLMENFEIGCKYPESDHMPIAFSINTGTPVIMINDGTLKWAPIERFDWNCNNLPSCGYFLNDCTSFTFKSIFYSAITAHENANSVANAFTGFFSQTCYRGFRVKGVNHPRAPGPAWFDLECGAVRKEAIDAGAHVECDNDQEKLVRTLKKYRALIQRKERAFKLKWASELQSAYCANKTHMWRLLSKFARTQSSSCGPSGGKLVNYYEQLAREPADETFDDAFINDVSEFLQIYDAKCSPAPMHDRLELEILNGNITAEEIESAIDSLKIIRQWE